MSGEGRLYLFVWKILLDCDPNEFCPYNRHLALMWPSPLKVKLIFRMIYLRKLLAFTAFQSFSHRQSGHGRLRSTVMQHALSSPDSQRSRENNLLHCDQLHAYLFELRPEQNFWTDGISLEETAASLCPNQRTAIVIFHYSIRRGNRWTSWLFFNNISPWCWELLAGRGSLLVLIAPASRTSASCPNINFCWACTLLCTLAQRCIARIL